jgi:hypothetical protein
MKRLSVSPWRAFVISSLGLGSLCGAAGCSSSSPATPGSGGTSGATGCDNIDFAAYKTAAPVSFAKDVMPLFGNTCIASTCHNPHDHNANLNLGPHCKYDSATKVCTYPADAAAAAALDPTMSQVVPYAPLDQATLDATYASLMLPSTTVLSPTVQRVVPGDPENSFIIKKVTGKQDGTGYMCKSQDPSHQITKDPCGDSMPLGGGLLCEGTSRPRFDVLAGWIAQGAIKGTLP